MKNYLFIVIYLFTGIHLCANHIGQTGDTNFSKNLITSIEGGISWNQYFNNLHQSILSSNDHPNIGILSIIDELGYPIGLPIYFEFQEPNFYFASDALSKRNENLKKNPNVSLLIYYKSINQSTFLVKGKTSLTTKKYEYSGVDKKHTQLIYEIVPDEINVSFLDDASRKNEGILRYLYVYKKNETNTWERSKRTISIEVSLDDLDAKMKQKTQNPLQSILQK